MEFANQSWFDRFDARLAAMGGAAMNNGGIENPQRSELQTGTRLVRFGSRSQAYIALDGGWWLSWNEYGRVIAYADQTKRSIPQAIRRLCALPTEWSDLTTMVQIRLTAPLLAYSGFGAAASEKSGDYPKIVDAHGCQVRQMYIPGLGNRDLQRAALAWEGQGYFPIDKTA